MLIDARGQIISDKDDQSLAAYEVKSRKENGEAFFDIFRIYYTSAFTEKVPKTKITIQHDEQKSSVFEKSLNTQEFKGFQELLFAGSVVIKISIVPKDKRYSHWFYDSITMEEHFSHCGNNAGHHLAEKIQIDGDYIVSVSEPQDDELEEALRRYLKLENVPSTLLINCVMNPMQSAFANYQRIEFHDEQTNKMFEVMLSTAYSFGYRYGKIHRQWETVEYNFFGCNQCSDGIMLDTHNHEWPCCYCIPENLRNDFAISHINKLVKKHG